MIVRPAASASDRGDVVLLAAGYAEALASGDLDEAARLAALAWHVAVGGFAVFREPAYDGAGRELCKILTRAGERCRRLASHGGLCGGHLAYARLSTPGGGVGT
ncbi:MAG TPA: hypothetical protein VNO17_01565 [Actinomycetota bacterium]|nr:hypothetical protein [Actinomycetota bacterium]